MKNESAFLQPAQDTESLAASAPPAHDPTIVHLPLYRPGTRVTYQGQYCTIGHVVVSRGQLQVYLQEIGNTVDAEKVRLAPTRLVLRRS